MLLFKVLILVVAMAIRVKTQVYDSGVSCDDIATIIDYHNELRQRVAEGKLEGQPQAADMQVLVWDDDLAETAQDWADNMEFKHNPDRGDGFEDRFQVGENIYISFSSASDPDYDWKGAIDAWYDEHKLYTYGPMDGNLEAGHYTQLIWANTQYVGCGVTYYEGDDGMKNKLYVCDYGPAGNWRGEAPYEEGSGCEDLCCDEQCDDDSYGDSC